MLIIEDTLEGGVPALFVLLGAVLVLAFIRLVVPKLIDRFQTKKPITNHEIKK